MTSENISQLSDLKPPEASLISLVEAHALQVLVFSGKRPEPRSGQTIKNMALARYNIQIMEILHTKTNGNLTPEEEHAITEYIKLAKQVLADVVAEDEQSQ